MSGSPRVVLGMPSYNGSAHLREALDSLLGQRYRDFVLVVVDDASLDATPAIVAQYAERDDRIRLSHNEHRIGMIDNWRRCYEHALREVPDMEYFAWVSDHDAWHPRWLKALVERLDSDPSAVVAYPQTLRQVFDKADWRPWLRPAPRYDSGDLAGVRRLASVQRNMFAGSMVYGLFRANDLKACGMFRHYLEPDRLLLLEMAMRGSFRQVDEILYYRQRFEKPTRARQRASMFVGRVPFTGMLSPTAGHTIGLLTSQAAPLPRRAVAATTNLALSSRSPKPSRLLGRGARTLAVRVDLDERAPIVGVTGRLVARLTRAVVHPSPSALGRP